MKSMNITSAKTSRYGVKRLGTDRQRRDHTESIDGHLLADRTGGRALLVSLIGLLVTASLQAVVVAASGSVGLLADTVHHFADAITALAIGLALWVARRPATAATPTATAEPKTSPAWPSSR
jgi:Co/Zn/Cd efflux system component